MFSSLSVFRSVTADRGADLLLWMETLSCCYGRNFPEFKKTLQSLFVILRGRSMMPIKSCVSVVELPVKHSSDINIAPLADAHSLGISGFLTTSQYHKHTFKAKLY